MKTESTNENESGLNQLLHEWKVESKLPPQFNEQVWRRIASEETPGVSFVENLRLQIMRLVARPSFGFSYVAILLLAGSLAGLWQAQTTSQRASDTLSARYVQMLDPYQMPRH